MTILLSLLAAFFGSLSNVTAKYIMANRLDYQKIGTMNFLTMSFMVGIFSPWFFYFRLDNVAILLMLTVGILDTFGNVCYFKALNAGEASIATVYFSVSPLWTLIIGIPFGGVGSWFIIPAVVMVTLPIVILSSGKEMSIKKLMKVSRGKQIWLALGCSLAFGTSAFILKLLFNTGSTNPPTVFLLRSLIIWAGLFTLWHPALWKVKVADWGIISGRGLLVIAKWLCLLNAISSGNVVAAVAVGNTTPLFVLLISVVGLKEKLTIPKVIASMSVIIGVSALQILSK